MLQFKGALWIALLCAARTASVLGNVSGASDSACMAVRSAVDITQAIVEDEEVYMTLCAAPDASRCVEINFQDSTG